MNETKESLSEKTKKEIYLHKLTSEIKSWDLDEMEKEKLRKLCLECIKTHPDWEFRDCLLHIVHIYRIMCIS